MIGEPDAGKPHVRFDEGVQETCDIAARLRPTLHRVPQVQQSLPPMDEDPTGPMGLVSGSGHAETAHPSVAVAAVLVRQLRGPHFNTWP